VSEPGGGVLELKSDPTPGAARRTLPFQGRDEESHATPNFFCRLVDEVVYWNTSRLSG
jgi:hypothetical protein